MSTTPNKPLNRQQKRSLSKNDLFSAVENLAQNVQQLSQKVQKADQDVDLLINLLVRNRGSHTHKIDKGDTVILGILGRLYGEDGKPNAMPFQGGVMDNLIINSLGNGEMIPGFEDNLVGLHPGSTIEFDVTFPEKYVESLAGKKATFLVAVHASFSKTDTTSLIPDKQNALIRSLIEEQQAQRAKEAAANEAANTSPAPSEAAPQ
jgi:trigger factor